MKKFRRPHIRGRRFYNHDYENVTKFFTRSLRMLFRYHTSDKDKYIDGASCWVTPSCPLSCSIDPVITWIGHASFLVQIGETNILLDPIFGELSFLYPRLLPPGVLFDKLPKIDFIIISHNHIDHMDAKSLCAVRDRDPEVIVLTPLGDKAWFDKRRFTHAYEHTWWEQRSFPLKDNLSQKINFTFLPASHWSQRGLFDKNKSLWGSWMIEHNGYTVYFGGDTCYSTHLGEIAQEFSDINVALMPVGPCEPRDWLSDWHLGAAEAGKGFLDLGATHMIPMHWGTFPFGVEHFDTPIKLMQQWWSQNQTNLSGKYLHCVPAGKQITFCPETGHLKKQDEHLEP